MTVAASPVGTLGACWSPDPPPPEDVSTTSCGAFEPSRELKSTPSVDVPARAMLYVPAPGINDVMSKVAHVPVESAPASATPLPVRAGRLFQVIPVSVQPLPVAYTAAPFAVGLVTHHRGGARWSVPDSGGTVKRRYVSTSGSVPPSTLRPVEVPAFVDGLPYCTTEAPAGVSVGAPSPA